MDGIFNDLNNTYMRPSNNFGNLPKNEQIYQLFKNGKELFGRRSRQYMIKLYSINGIFVELWYLDENNLIERIELIEEEKLLEIYKNQINIQDLMNH
ncbi:MAG: hypothetical protein JW731_16905 [Bacteroidales bacterium]|nr:hypothetical protein [Bacteroidales bacterium]